jgi:hypothetical protein
MTFHRKNKLTGKFAIALGLRPGTREDAQYSKAIQLGKCVAVVVHARGAKNRIKAPGILSSVFNDLQPNRAYAKNLISNRGNNLPGREGGAR